MSDETTVGHCKKDTTDTYIGRGPDGRDMVNTTIGNRGWLGNPFPVTDECTRGESIGRFRRVFKWHLQSDPEFKNAVRDLSGGTLGCWCQTVDDDGPACHGEVIAEWADKLAGGEE